MYRYTVGTTSLRNFFPALKFLMVSVVTAVLLFL